MRYFDYVIYHKNCLDGFSGFIILNKTGLISKDAIIYPDVPSVTEIPPKIENRNVIITDVAYKKVVLEKIFEYAKTVVFIDHHVTIRDDVLNLKKNKKYINHEIVYDEQKSGSSLTWIYFNGNKKIPWFVKYIEDNDVGRWKYKNTLYFILALHINYDMKSTEENIKNWNQLYENNMIQKLIKNGKKYYEYEDYLIDKNSKRFTLEYFPSKMLYNNHKKSFEKPGQYRVAVINGGCPSISLLGKKIVDNNDCDFCIIWTLHMEKKQYVLSFRSKKTNVGDIAKIFGGGGHEFASACSIPIKKYNIVDLFYAK